MKMLVKGKVPGESRVWVHSQTLDKRGRKWRYGRTWLHFGPSERRRALGVSWKHGGRDKTFGVSLTVDKDEWPDVPLPSQEKLDVDMAEKLNELLRIGDMVAGHFERVLERTGPLPEWLLIKLNELQGLLYGRAGRDADIYDPGLTTLLDELYTKHIWEKGQ